MPRLAGGVAGARSRRMDPPGAVGRRAARPLSSTSAPTYARRRVRNSNPIGRSTWIFRLSPKEASAWPADSRDGETSPPNERIEHAARDREAFALEVEIRMDGESSQRVKARL